MKTVGENINELCSASKKLWDAQDELYVYRRMTFEEFKSLFDTEEGARKVYDIFKGAMDLNVDRSTLVSEIDKALVEKIKEIVSK